VDPLLHLPLKNEFIPINFALRNADMAKPQSHVNPVCIIDQPFLKFWYKLDFTFNVPRACTYFLITVKDGYRTLKSSILTELFVNLLKDELNDTIYQVREFFCRSFIILDVLCFSITFLIFIIRFPIQAYVAKLESSLTITGDKLELKLYGYNDKIPVLLLKIVSLLHNFSPKLDRFKVLFLLF
jgi:nardilysin